MRTVTVTAGRRRVALVVGHRDRNLHGSRLRGRRPRGGRAVGRVEGAGRRAPGVGQHAAVGVARRRRQQHGAAGRDRERVRRHAHRGGLGRGGGGGGGGDPTVIVTVPLVVSPSSPVTVRRIGTRPAAEARRPGHRRSVLRVEGLRRRLPQVGHGTAVRVRWAVAVSDTVPPGSTVIELHGHAHPRARLRRRCSRGRHARCRAGRIGVARAELEEDGGAVADIGGDHAGRRRRRRPRPPSSPGASVFLRSRPAREVVARDAGTGPFPGLFELARRLRIH